MFLRRWFARGLIIHDGKIKKGVLSPRGICLHQDQRDQTTNLISINSLFCQILFRFFVGLDLDPFPSEELILGSVSLTPDPGSCMMGHYYYHGYIFYIRLYFGVQIVKLRLIVYIDAGFLLGMNRIQNFQIIRPSNILPWCLTKAG